MPQRARRLFAPVLLTNAALGTPGYYKAVSVKTVIKKLVVTNPTATAYTFTLYLVPSGSTASATNTIVSAQTVLPGQSYEVFQAQNMVIEDGGFIDALASTTNVLNIQGSGVETDVA